MGRVFREWPTAPTLSERDFQRAVIDLAHTFGWKIAHFRTAMNARGAHMTPVGGDGKGWPDLVLVHPAAGLILYRELKSATGHIESAQRDWCAWLEDAGQDFAFWRPGDWDEIVETLSFGRAVA